MISNQIVSLESSWLEAFIYQDNGILLLLKRDGKIMVVGNSIHPVPPDLPEVFSKAESPGKVFNQFVRGQLPIAVIEPWWDEDWRESSEL